MSPLTFARASTRSATVLIHPINSPLHKAKRAARSLFKTLKRPYRHLLHTIHHNLVGHRSRTTTKRPRRQGVVINTTVPPANTSVQLAACPPHSPDIRPWPVSMPRTRPRTTTTTTPTPAQPVKTSLGPQRLDEGDIPGLDLGPSAHAHAHAHAHAQEGSVSESQYSQSLARSYSVYSRATTDGPPGEPEFGAALERVVAREDGMSGYMTVEAMMGALRLDRTDSGVGEEGS
ncbi:hypothetical protein CAC42_3237 [Sphaceloma murrayae]|uniref:Uncharacterized protein n=1 Tax=Sphaceloma murrayae TaxID=2082308 RepID=A0A2K1QFD2_9PEZI|nr:hypothetical protein CAC42_3237 [Sphaceloma murrayae]